MYIRAAPGHQESRICAGAEFRAAGTPASVHIHLGNCGPDGGQDVERGCDHRLAHSHRTLIGCCQGILIMSVQTGPEVAYASCNRLSTAWTLEPSRPTARSAFVGHNVQEPRPHLRSLTQLLQLAPRFESSLLGLQQSLEGQIVASLRGVHQ